MSCHIVLNSVFEYIVHGHHGFFMSTTHYDFWTRQKISNTATAMNIDIMLGCFYYLLFHEKNRKIASGCVLLMTVSMFYLVVIGRRTPVMMIFIAFVLSFIYESIVLKKGSEKIRKSFTSIMILSSLFVAVLALVYGFDLFHCRAVLDNYHIVQKFTKGFINDQRFALYFGSFPLMPKYLWGGQNISAILGEQVHDFWIDIYDYAGIVAFAIMICYSLIFVRDMFRFFKCSRISDDFKIFTLGVVIRIVIQMFLEPVMTGASLFLLVAIITHAMLERLIKNEQ
jgi:hypothetical protein